jgi:hypothetical protein
MSAVLEKKKAKELITENARDYLTAKVKIPLGNPALKNVHTNQFLFMTFPEDFSLQNWATIAKALNSSDTRFSGYSKSRWYIEGCTIDVDVKGKAEMSLDLNAFASTTKEFTDGYRALTKAYEDAVNKTVSSTKAKTTSSAKTTTNAVSNGKNTTLKGGEGSFIDNKVKSIVGNETDALKKAKLIHEHIRSKQKYAYYTDSKYSSAKACYEHIRAINCADMSRLTASMMRSAGISCYVVHSTCHYYTVLKINGKLYCSDNASTNATGRQFNYYWKGNSCKSGSTVSFKGKSSYDKVCGKTPCT